MSTYTVTLTLGQRIRLAREAAGMKQADLAIALGTARTTISNWENDDHRPARVYMRVIAEITGREPGFFTQDDMSFSSAVTQGYTRPLLVRLSGAA